MQLCRVFHTYQNTVPSRNPMVRRSLLEFGYTLFVFFSVISSGLLSSLCSMYAISLSRTRPMIPGWVKYCFAHLPWLSYLVLLLAIVDTGLDNYRILKRAIYFHSFHEIIWPVSSYFFPSHFVKFQKGFFWGQIAKLLYCRFKLGTSTLLDPRCCYTQPFWLFSFLFFSCLSFNSSVPLLLVK